MSLDVYLTRRQLEPVTIYAAKEGSVVEVSLEEWQRHFPGTRPHAYRDEERLYSDNITHNLTRMADAAGIYKELWRPEEIGITQAKQLIEPLRRALVDLLDCPDKFKAFAPESGWGTYGGLVRFVSNYLAACERFPDARVSVCR